MLAKDLKVEKGVPCCLSMDSCLSYKPICSQINQREEEKSHHQLMTLRASRRFLSILGLLGYLDIDMSPKALGVLLCQSMSRSCDSHGRYLVVGRLTPMDELMVLLWQY